MLEKKLASIGVTVPLHTKYVPYIPYLTNIHTTSASNETNHLTCDSFYRP